jgi:hypothetical protein
MKKSPSKHPVRRATAKGKRVAKKAARHPAKLTQAKAAKTLQQLKAAVTALKPKGKGGSAPSAAIRVQRALGVATRLNQLVKGMKKASIL